MVRMSKQGERRNRYRSKHRPPMPKTGPMQDNLPNGFKELSNALEGDFALTMYVPKIK